MLLFTLFYDDKCVDVAAKISRCSIEIGQKMIETVATSSEDTKRLNTSEN